MAEGFEEGEIMIDLHNEIAGAYYGEYGIPENWREKITMNKTILTMTENIYQLTS